MRQLHEIRMARAALSRLIEPGDETALHVVRELGPVRGVRVLCGQDSLTDAQVVRLAGSLGSLRGWTRRFDAGRARWAPRAAHLDPLRDLQSMHRLGGGFLIPEDPAWPTSLNDLGLNTPVGLWYRGGSALPEQAQMLAVVGSRESTPYGAGVVDQLVGEVAREGTCIVSGGAYGIDGLAHRSALHHGTGAPPTLAVLAGGLDRFYPAGHETLLRQVMDRGLLLSEMAPGASPTRHRFLHRNRLIAALSIGVLVVEARWRSGAQNTAHHALALGRSVGAVPGPITSPSSAGCHRLLLDTPTELITDAVAVRSLLTGTPATPAPRAASAEATGQHPLLDGQQPGVSSQQVPSHGQHPAQHGDQPRPGDDLPELDRLVHDALPLRRAVPTDRLAVGAGVGVPQLAAALQRLARAGLAQQTESGWRKAARVAQ
ncbi:MAG: DNA-processing protein DprA [Micrococcus sp.]|nr:DNA-processing protein DprA [Micrococcus sp.]